MKIAHFSYLSKLWVVFRIWAVMTFFDMFVQWIFKSKLMVRTQLALKWHFDIIFKLISNSNKLFQVSNFRLSTFSQLLTNFLSLFQSLFTFLEELLVVNFENSYYFYVKPPKLWSNILFSFIFYLNFTLTSMKQNIWIGVLEVWQKFWLIPSLILCKSYILEMWSNSKW